MEKATVIKTVACIDFFPKEVEVLEKRVVKFQIGTKEENLNNYPIQSYINLFDHRPTVVKAALKAAEEKEEICLLRAIREEAGRIEIKQKVIGNLLFYYINIYPTDCPHPPDSRLSHLRFITKDKKIIVKGEPVWNWTFKEDTTLEMVFLTDEFSPIIIEEKTPTKLVVTKLDSQKEITIY